MIVVSKLRAESDALSRTVVRVVASDTAILISLAFLKFGLHLAGIGRYGFFRDELYYLACGRHLAWGYVDQPPLIAAVAWLSENAFGTSLGAARIFPALAGAVLVFLAGLLAREFGGGRFAQCLAATFDSVRTSDPGDEQLPVDERV